MNKNETGIPYVFSTGFDLTGFSSLSITFTKPDGTTLTVNNPAVSAPAVDIETTLGMFPSGTYASYTFVEGDVDQSGEWTARVTYDDVGQHLISDIGNFVVNI